MQKLTFPQVSHAMIACRSPPLPSYVVVFLTSVDGSRCEPAAIKPIFREEKLDTGSWLGLTKINDYDL